MMFRRFRVREENGDAEEGVDKKGYGRKWKRRVTDPVTGKVTWENFNPRDFHPGQGVYRSSYKNTRRLAVTETNIAYRTSDHLRWQQMDFVVGIRVVISNNHTLNGVAFTDICDRLSSKKEGDGKGLYPKDFKFVGWHPHCRCHVETVLKTEDEMQEDTQRILNGLPTTTNSVNTVKDTPPEFKAFANEFNARNEERGAMGLRPLNTPYFIRDNRGYFDKALGIEPEVRRTPQEIAEERHNARTPEQAAAIQDTWNKRRIENIEQMAAQGLLPKESVEGLAALPQDEFNDRIAFLQKRAAKHADRTQEDIKVIQEAWTKRVFEHDKIRRDADRVLAIAKTWQEVDYSALESLISQGKLAAMQTETRKVMDALKAMRAEEKALEDVLHDVHGWHKFFSLAELKEAHTSVQSTLDFWETKYGADLATDSNLTKLLSELENKIKFVENPGAFKHGAKPKKYWQVTQDSYQQMYDKVEKRIAVKEMTAKYTGLLGFKTTSPDFKEYLASAKSLLDDEDPIGAQYWLDQAAAKREALEARRGGGGSSIKFKNMTEEKIKDLLDQFDTNTVEGQDKKLRPWTKKAWESLTEEERFMVTKYTQTYKYLNDRLRTGSTTSWRSESEYKHDLPILTRALNKIKAPRDMVVRRGVDDYLMPDIGKRLSGIAEGDIITEKGFLSTACHRDKGFFCEYEMVILVPKGARGIYAEPFSHYTDYNIYDFETNDIWNGEDKQPIRSEFEWVGQRGAQFKVIKKIGKRIYLQLISQLK